MLIAALDADFSCCSAGWRRGRRPAAPAPQACHLLTSVQLALTVVIRGQTSLLSPTPASRWWSALRLPAVIMRHRSLARNRLDRKPIAAEAIGERSLRSPNASRTEDRVAIASLMQHRLALLAARITVVPAEARRDAANLRQLRTALSIINRPAGWTCHAAQRRRSKNCSPVLLRFAGPTRPAGFRTSWSDGSTARLHRRCENRRARTAIEALIGLAGIRAGSSRSRALSAAGHEHRRVAA